MSEEEVHEKFMRRCLYLAQLGLGQAAPNPLVGSVIVRNGEIIGEGYHQKYGEAHAEVNAVHAVKDKDLLKDSTLYVNLEPCAHFGKTPPCSNLIIEMKIPRVVIGCIDTFSEVAGKGIAKMKAAGIDVIVGVLETESKQLNKRFFTFHNQKRPFITLKWAQSSDHFIDINRSNNEKGIHWITQPETKTLVHQWRSQEMGILVGRQTIKNDNPRLNCRNFDGKSPVRIIIDPDLKLDIESYHIGISGEKTIILNRKKNEAVKHLAYLMTEDFSVDNIVKILYEQDIQSLIVEGGKITLEKFITSNIWDEAKILTGSAVLNEGTRAPVLNAGIHFRSSMFGKDRVDEFRRITEADPD